MMGCYIRFCSTYDTDNCHILSRGAYPHYKDEEWNIIKMCRKHHSEQHTIGWTRFISKYDLTDVMINRGLYYCPLSKRWKKGLLDE